jgi:hypothetical protein
VQQAPTIGVPAACGAESFHTIAFGVIARRFAAKSVVSNEKSDKRNRDRDRGSHTGKSPWSMMLAAPGSG